MKLGIFFGGRSAEHKVSCMSAASIYENVDKDKFTPYLVGVDFDGKMYHYDGDINTLRIGNWKEKITENEVVILDRQRSCGVYGRGTNIVFDVLFPVMHGAYGEDGKIQGVFSYTGLPFVGPGVIDAAISMDKDMAKKLFMLAEINQTQYKTFKYYEKVEDSIEIIEAMGYPMFVKPANSGSSLGINKVNNRYELYEACRYARLYDDKVIVEKGCEVRELEVAVLGNQDEIRISDIGEIISCDEFYDYDAKYIKNQSQLIIPAIIDKEQMEAIKNMAKKAYEAIDIEGMARVDFFLDKNTGEIYLNEVNTIPGFTNMSMYPKLFEHSGLAYKDLITKLIELSIERGKRQREFRYL